MSYTYLFFQPRRLPLAAEELSEETVDVLTDPVVVKTALARVLPQIVWTDDKWGRGETADGRWFEFLIADGGTLGLSCSFRADYRADVQAICDAIGWIAVDQTPFVYMPGCEPGPA